MPDKSKQDAAKTSAHSKRIIDILNVFRCWYQQYMV